MQVALSTVAFTTEAEIVAEFFSVTFMLKNNSTCNTINRLKPLAD